MIVWPGLFSSCTCHKSKKEIVTLKLDFEKDIDKVEHEVILQVLEHKGFSSKWID